MLIPGIVASGQQVSSGGGDPGDFTWTTNLLYRFAADLECYSDTAGTVACTDSDTVAVWGNQGSEEDAQQTTSANRPTFKTGGLNGRPYIECAAASAQFFEDLALPQPSGFTSMNPFTVFVVTDNVTGLSDGPSILGNTDSSTHGKGYFRFEDVIDAQIALYKSAIKVGNVANPQMIMAAAGRNADGTTSSPYSRFWIRQNETDVYTDPTQGTNQDSSAGATTEFLRCTSLSSNGYFNGRLYEFLYYDGTLDDTTTFAIEDYLMAKYGIV